MTIRQSFCRISAPRDHHLNRAPSAQRDRQPSVHSCSARCATKIPSAYATHPVHGAYCKIYGTVRKGSGFVGKVKNNIYVRINPELKLHVKEKRTVLQLETVVDPEILTFQRVQEPCCSLSTPLV